MGRILIQKTGSGQFYKHPNEWVGDKGKATAFPNTLDAWGFCALHQLSGINLLMDFGEPRFDVPLFMPSCSEPSPPKPSTPRQQAA